MLSPKTQAILALSAVTFAGCKKDPIEVERVPQPRAPLVEYSSTEYSSKPSPDLANLPGDTRQLLVRSEEREVFESIFLKLPEGKALSRAEVALLGRRVYEARCNFSEVLQLSQQSMSQDDYIRKYGPASAPKLHLNPAISVDPDATEVPPYMRPVEKSIQVRQAIVGLNKLIPALLEIIAESPSAANNIDPLDQILKEDPRMESLRLLQGVRSAASVGQRLEELKKATAMESALLPTMASAEAQMHYREAVDNLKRTRPDLFEPLHRPEDIRAYVREILQALTIGSENVAPRLRIFENAAAIRKGLGDDHVAAYHHYPSDSVTIRPGPRLEVALFASHEIGHAVIRIDENIDFVQSGNSPETIKALRDILNLLDSTEQELAAALRASTSHDSLPMNASLVDALISLQSLLAQPYKLTFSFESPLLTQLEESSAYLFQKAALQFLAKGDTKVANWLETYRLFQSYAPRADLDHIPAYVYADTLALTNGTWAGLHGLSALSTNFAQMKPTVSRDIVLSGLSVGILPSAGDQTILGLATGMIDLTADSLADLTKFDLSPTILGAQDRVQQLASKIALKLQVYLDGMYPAAELAPHKAPGAE